MQALWEQLNETKWAKNKENDRDYMIGAFQDPIMEQQPEEEEEEVYKDTDNGQKSEYYDTDEEEDDVVTRDDDANVNSQLAVGYKYDRTRTAEPRSFVQGGPAIDDFESENDGDAEDGESDSDRRTIALSESSDEEASDSESGLVHGPEQMTST